MINFFKNSVEMYLCLVSIMGASDEQGEIVRPVESAKTASALSTDPGAMLVRADGQAVRAAAKPAATEYFCVHVLRRRQLGRHLAVLPEHRLVGDEMRQVQYIEQLPPTGQGQYHRRSAHYALSVPVRVQSLSHSTTR